MTWWWVAQILEFDLSTQARTLDDLIAELQRIVVAHIVCSTEQGLDPFAIPPAPQQYVDEYGTSKSCVTIDSARDADDPISQQLPLFSARFAPGV